MRRARNEISTGGSATARDQVHRCGTNLAQGETPVQRRRREPLQPPPVRKTAGSTSLSTAELGHGRSARGGSQIDLRITFKEHHSLNVFPTTEPTRTAGDSARAVALGSQSDTSSRMRKRFNGRNEEQHSPVCTGLCKGSAPCARAPGRGAVAEPTVAAPQARSWLVTAPRGKTFCLDRRPKMDRGSLVGPQERGVEAGSKSNPTSSWADGTGTAARCARPRAQRPFSRTSRPSWIQHRRHLCPQRRAGFASDASAMRFRPLRPTLEK